MSLSLCLTKLKMVNGIWFFWTTKNKKRTKIIIILFCLCFSSSISPLHFIIITDNVSKLCSRERHTLPLYKKIDGAVISSDMTDVELDCIMTFQTDTILQRFQLRFEELALDCNDHLYIFDGAHAFNPKVSDDESCRWLHLLFKVTKFFFAWT